MSWRQSLNDNPGDLGKAVLPLMLVVGRSSGGEGGRRLPRARDGRVRKMVLGRLQGGVHPVSVDSPVAVVVVVVVVWLSCGYAEGPNAGFALGVVFCRSHDPFSLCWLWQPVAVVCCSCRASKANP